MVRRATEGGFTLIEVVVVLLIMVLMALMAAPFASGWRDSAEVRLSVHRLQEGMGRARSLALQNSTAAQGDEPVVYLVWTGTTLCVQRTSAGGVSCAGSPAWSATLSASIELNGAAKQCVALNSGALPVEAALGATTCGTDLGYAVSKGGQRYPDHGTDVLI